ncbi:MAG: head-tail adaptor protein [Rhizobiales bacterium]|nr:head-tail adaptor protein [Hyphomicrobiales bacterium]
MADTDAARLYERVHCQKRVAHDDGYGNTVGEFETQFTVRAGYHHLRGGEAVIASRLENRHPVLITVRSSSQTRLIDSNWRLVDARIGTEWAIRDVTAETDRRNITLLCEGGVAS